MNREFIVDESCNPDILFLIEDFYDEAFVGTIEVDGEAVAVYDEDLIVEALIKTGMSETDAVEYYDFNISQTYVGKYTPLFMRRY